MHSSVLHNGKCSASLSDVRQRQQCSHARALRRLAGNAKACRKDRVRHRGSSICAASAAVTAEPPSTDLDLQGADFCGREGVQLCNPFPWHADLCIFMQYISHMCTLNHDNAICRPSAEQSSPIAVANTGRRRKEVLHPHLWLPGKDIFSTALLILNIGLPARAILL